MFSLFLFIIKDSICLWVMVDQSTCSSASCSFSQGHGAKMVWSSLCHIGSVSILSSLGEQVQCGWECALHIMCSAHPVSCLPLLTFPWVSCVNVQRLGLNIGRALHSSCSHPPSCYGPLQGSGILGPCVWSSSFYLCLLSILVLKFWRQYVCSDYIFVEYVYDEITYSYTIHFRVYWCLKLPVLGNVLRT